MKRCRSGFAQNFSARPAVRRSLQLESSLPSLRRSLARLPPDPVASKTEIFISVHLDSPWVGGPASPTQFRHHGKVRLDSPGAASVMFDTLLCLFSFLSSLDSLCSWLFASGIVPPKPPLLSAFG